MSLLTITVDTSAATQHLGTLEERLTNLRPLLKVIGEELTESTKRRFETSTGPQQQHQKSIPQNQEPK